MSRDELPSVRLSAAFAAAIEDAGLWSWWLKNRGRSWAIDSGMPLLHEAAKAHRTIQRNSEKMEPTGTKTTSIGESLRQSRTRVVGTAVAARRLGVTPRAVLKMIARGRLTAKRDGGRWLISADSIETIRKEK